MRNIHLWQITDTHCYADDQLALEWSALPVYPNLSLQQVLDNFQQQLRQNSQAADALIISGDLVQTETLTTYQRINQLLQSLPIPSYALPGNHDQPNLMQQALKGRVSCPSIVQFDQWFVLLLDTSKPNKPDGHLSAEQLAILQQQLAQLPPDAYAIIFMHHQPELINSAWMDAMGLQQKVAFWQTLAPFPQLKAVFHGHIHHEYYTVHRFANGRCLPIYGTPATSIQLQANHPVFALASDQPAWRTITLNRDGSIDTLVNYLSKL
jgi:Icc protein